MEAVEERIEKACRVAGRHRDEITLVAVTKVFPAAIICEAYELGLRHFGENYVQEFAGKISTVSNLRDACFHLIGHLQSNKARTAAGLFHTIQTVDTPKLAKRLDECAVPLNLMIEVKLSHEDAKAGALPEDLGPLIDAIRECPNLHLTGLMTMPPWTEQAELSRPYFRTLSELAARHNLRDLSMGMSHDFEVAIEEGATHVRIGTALFGSRKKV